MNVLLVHGLGRTPVALFWLARALRRAGHRPRFFGYSPTLETVPHIARRLAARLKALAGPGRPVGLIGHSLGGLLLRMTLPEAPDLRVHRLIMMGTPNRPSRMARLAWRRVAFRWLARGCGRLLATEGGDAPPVPRCPYTLIAGTAGPRGRYSPFGEEANDGVVGVGEIPVRDDDQPMLFPVWHTIMMNDRAIHQVIIALLDTPAPTGN